MLQFASESNATPLRRFGGLSAGLVESTGPPSTESIDIPARFSFVAKPPQLNTRIIHGTIAPWRAGAILTLLMTTPYATHRPT
jgi:hypothetical protein